MLFVIHALDKADALPRRLAAYEAHKAFLARCEADFNVKMVMSGPLVADDGATMVGSFLLMEAPDRASVERFNAADPFAKAGIWQSRSITAFLRRVG
jgi:uncharacterized protein YciI